MLSQKAKYAIKALLVLARAQDKNLPLVQARDISAGQNIPKKFLDLIWANAFAPLSHHEPVSNLIKPQQGNHSTLSRQAGQDLQTVFSVGLVLQEPLQRK